MNKNLISLFANKGDSDKSKFNFQYNFNYEIKAFEVFFEISNNSVANAMPIPCLLNGRERLNHLIYQIW